MLTDTEKQLREIVDSVAQELEVLCAGESTEDYDDIYDWFNDQLCVEEYSFFADGSFKDAQISVCLGGPNVFVYPGTCEVKGYWANDSYSNLYKMDIFDEDPLYELMREQARYTAHLASQDC